MRAGEMNEAGWPTLLFKHTSKNVLYFPTDSCAYNAIYFMAAPEKISVKSVKLS